MVHLSVKHIKHIITMKKKLFIITCVCVCIFAGCNSKTEPVRQGKSTLVEVNFWGSAKLSDKTELQLCDDAAIGDTVYYVVNQDGKVAFKKLARADEVIPDYSPKKAFGVVFLGLIALAIISSVTISKIVIKKEERELNKPLQIPDEDLYF